MLIIIILLGASFSDTIGWELTKFSILITRNKFNYYECVIFSIIIYIFRNNLQISNYEISREFN